MNGTAHATIGAATGFIIANNLQSTPSQTLLLIGIGTVSGLLPDLDIDGKLRGKITLSHKMFRAVAQLIGVLLICYSFYEGANNERYIGMGIGLALLALSSSIKQKHMLTITGIGILAGGLSLQEMWLLLLGIYILIASFVAHRTYTHSILGVIFFGFIAANLESSLAVDGVYYTCLIGYISHLVGDSKFLPFNKRGIKLFLPIWSKDM
ncbi:MAG: metal-dependent hydrolase [Bacillota bacterium]|uniref:Metal-dependent hydrolase n=1 Tax=Virgibacillus salarius TaxID=447199 RepID=A0A941DT98_9BACI|nr:MULTISPECIES: metal-dependent hydrolase [Bacillaceae]NAZ09003.1 metal-dependent hydrolase [Agaribacter marinus]MBR7796295.1 metal-dependent hydrolase [Virgibacillus salarius]MCC2248527.1 metal-dependent hydrolase [Virgibacillus sp. AGTR]MDY7043038.1 metal-dependent hydrolase [Virgibacillus sp. M23]QRZ16612.1 metal-dependent hydrolase [Virgibacillus sp. AGTR]